MQDIVNVLLVLVLVLAAYKLLMAFRSLRAIRRENVSLTASRASRAIRAEIILILAMSVLFGTVLVTSNPAILFASSVVVGAGLVAFIAYRR